MSEANAFDFGKFIPGFDFLQNLATTGKGAAGPVSALHNWVAPTISVEELDKRIKELKAVLFWLEQNGTALKATIQALEVQKMTLATLQGMNLSMAEVAKAFTLPTQGAPAAPPAAAAPAPASKPDQWPFAAAAPAPQAAPAPAPVPQAEAPAEAPPSPEPEAAAPPRPAPARKRKSAAAAPAAPAAGLADPMQWWGALTQQFQQIAASALRDAAKPPAGVADGASDSVAASADSAGAAAQKGSKKAARKSAPKAASAPRGAANTARKSPARKAAAAKKPAAKAAKPAANTAKAAAKPAAKPAATGWPLPPPFKFGR